MAREAPTVFVESEKAPGDSDSPPGVYERASIDWLNNLSNQTDKLREPAMPDNGNETVGYSAHPEKLLWTLYKESRQYTNGANFALTIYDERTDTLFSPIVFEQGEKTQAFSIKSSNNQGLVARVLRAQTPLLVQNLPETGIVVETDPICPNQSVRSWLSVPIRGSATSQRARGVIVVWSKEPNAFTRRHLELLSALAARAAVALEKAHLHANAPNERGRVMEAEERLRKALARGLHDGPLQLVSTITIGLDFCREVLKMDPALLPEQISRLRELAEQAVQQLRDVLFELRPVVLETQGLEAALQVLLDHHKKLLETTHLTLNIESYHSSGEISRQGATIEMAIFSIVQEGICNALKHAWADAIKVCIKETPTHIHASVTDDGYGFDLEKVLTGYEQQENLGLLNIRERTESVGGDLTIESGLGQGTRLLLCVPKAVSPLTPI